MRTMFNLNCPYISGHNVSTYKDRFILIFNPNCPYLSGHNVSKYEDRLYIIFNLNGPIFKDGLDI